MRVEIEASREIGEKQLGGVLGLLGPSGGSVEFRVGGDPNKAVWHIPQLAGLSQHTLGVDFSLFDGEVLRFVFAVSNDFPAEAFNLRDNAGGYFHIDPGGGAVSNLVVPGHYSVQATPVVGDSTGNIVVFDVTTSLAGEHEHTSLLNALVNIRLTPGLEHISNAITTTPTSSNTIGTPSYTHSGNTGRWDIGHWQKGEPEHFHLRLRTRLASGVEASEQCLTAEMSGFPEALGENGVDARADNTVKACAPPLWMRRCC